MQPTSQINDQSSHVEEDTHHEEIGRADADDCQQNTNHSHEDAVGMTHNLQVVGMQDLLLYQENLNTFIQEKNIEKLTLGRRLK